MENKGFKRGLVTLLLTGAIALSPILSGCSNLNPIENYKTSSIREKESDLYQEYKNIDMNKISNTEKTYLEEIHKKYGVGKINYKNLKENNAEDKILENYKFLFGHEDFEDKDLIFMNRKAKELSETLIMSM
ncbi:MAG: hypothetical protein WCX73_03365 [Candidatus Pacearchaeota archaeon]|jgi:hypothetical protein